MTNVTLDEKTGLYIGTDGRRYSLAGSGNGETLIPMDPDPAIDAAIERNKRRADEAKARIAPQIAHHERCIAALEREMLDAGCYVPRRM